MKKNNVKNNAKRTGMKAAIVMAAILAVGTPFAIHGYKMHCEQTVQTVEVNAASGSRTASAKANQKAETKAAETEKTTTATTESAASKAAAAKKADNKTTSTTAAKKTKNQTTTTTAAKKQETKTSAYTVDSRSMTVYGTAESGLNVHSSADTSASCIGSLGYRESVKVTGAVLKDGKDTGWYRVSYNGTTGYVKADYVSTSQPAEKKAPEKKEPQKYEVDFMTLYQTLGDEVRTVCIYSDGSIADGNGVTYTAINGCEYRSSDGIQWSDSVAETPAEPETHTVGTVTMTVSVPDGYLALRSCPSDGDNEIGQLYSGTSVEVNQEDINACNLYVQVTVPSTGMSGYVNVSYLY